MIRRWLRRRGSAKMVTRMGGRDYLWRVFILTVPRWLRSRTWVRRYFYHVFYMSDPDPLHNHPWNWGRLILWGSYREHYVDGTSLVFGPGHVVRYRAASDFHRVELLTPTVGTVFWHGTRIQRWGFLYPGGFEYAPDHGQDGREMVGTILPRKVGADPQEIDHDG